MSGTPLSLRSLIGQAPFYAGLSYLAAICASLVQILPFFWIYLYLLAPATAPSLWWALVSFCCHPVLFAASTYLAHQSAFRIQNFLRKKLFLHLIELPLSNHHHTGIHHNQRILTEDIDILELFYAHQLPELIATLSNILLSLAVLTYLSWQVTLVFLALILLIGISASLILRNHETRIKTYFQKLSIISRIASDFVTALDLIKAPQTGRYVHNMYQNAITDFTVFSLNWFRNWGKGWGLYVLLSHAGLVCILPIALYLISIDVLTLESFIAISLIINGLTPFILRLMNYSETFLRVQMGIRNINKFLTQTNRASSNQIAKTRITPLPATLPTGTQIHIEKLCYTAPQTEKTFLQDITCTLPIGQSIYLFGPSGSGKTTFLSLLAGYLSPSQGRMSFTGTPDIPFDPRLFGFCHQRALFMSGSLLDNILLGQPFCPADLDLALEISTLNNVISVLPEGLDSPVGDQGHYLSGGQRQRLALARAIYQRNPILLLDELSAHLDPQTAARIQKNLTKLLPERTIIQISHCPVQIATADHVILFEKGRIHAEGTPNFLSQNNKAYRQYQHLYTSLISPEISPVSGAAT